MGSEKSGSLLKKEVVCEERMSKVSRNKRNVYIDFIRIAFTVPTLSLLKYKAHVIKLW